MYLLFNSQKMKSLKYIHSEPTRIRKEQGGAKINIKKNDIVKVEDKIADELLKTYPKYFQEQAGGTLPKKELDKLKKEIKKELEDEMKDGMIEEISKKSLAKAFQEGGFKHIVSDADLKANDDLVGVVEVGEEIMVSVFFQIEGEQEVRA